MRSIMLSGIEIRRNEQGLYCLNDLFAAKNKPKGKSVALFMRSKTTVGLIQQLMAETDDLVYVTYTSGDEKGTWGCSKLLIAYAIQLCPILYSTILELAKDEAAFLRESDIHEEDMEKVKTAVVYNRVDKRYLVISAELLEEKIQKINNHTGTTVDIKLVLTGDLRDDINEKFRHLQSKGEMWIQDINSEFKSFLEHCNNPLKNFT